MSLDFELTVEQQMIVKTASDIARKFGPEYWREREKKHEFPEEFWKTLVDAGFAGMIIPKEYGGEGMGMFEMILAMETLVSEGCGLAGEWFLCLSTIFGGLTITRHGSETQKAKYLPKLA